MHVTQRDRLLVSHHTVTQQTSRLDRITRIAAETEAIGSATLSTLESQSEQLKYADNKTAQMEENVTRAQGAIKRMVRRNRWMKLMYVLAALTLIGVLVGVLVALKAAKII